MNSPNITGKHRASRIPLDYYKSADTVTRKKQFFLITAIVAVLVWIAIMFVAPAKSVLGLKRFSHGPICKQHASFGHACSECHVSFSLFAGKDKDPLGRSAFPGDRKCLECHLGNFENDRWEGREFAAHHATQNFNMTPNCGSCHRDHRGEGVVDLKRVTDQQCTNCHKDLDRAIAGSEPRYMKEVTSFTDNHPEFSSAKGKDPGKLKFNHKYHMTPGIVLASGEAPFRVRQMVAGGQRDAMMGSSRKLQENDPVQLDCKDCHRNESATKSEFASISGLPETKKEFNEEYNKQRQSRGHWDSGELMANRSDQAYLEPIVFEKHCAACHPLTVGGTTVTHRQQPDALRQEVARLIDGGEIEFKDRTPLLQIGKPPSSASSGGLKREERVEVALRMLLEGKRTCGECHVTKDGTDISIASTEIAKPNVPNNWFRHARFDHGKHEAKGITDCKKCHAGAYATTDADLMSAYLLPRKGAEAVMLPMIDNCRECHTAKPSKEIADRGWAARHDCTECHTYHHGQRRTTP